MAIELAQRQLGLEEAGTCSSVGPGKPSNEDGQLAERGSRRMYKKPGSLSHVYSHAWA